MTCPTSAPSRPWLRRLATGAVLALIASTALLASPLAGRAIYCIQGPKGEWALQRFKPLINAQGGTTFAELSFEGATLREVRLRRFFPDSELTFDYSFDAAGKLAALKGTVTVRTVGPALPGDPEPPVFADWLGEAELTPGSDGKIPPHHVIYTREKDRIEKPDDADKYVARFDDAPVYATVQSIPCATKMKEAEKMNAAQD
jgi:hypothetical protein